MNEKSKCIVLDSVVFIDAWHTENLRYILGQIVLDIDSNKLQLGVDFGDEILDDYDIYLNRFFSLPFAKTLLAIINKERFQPKHRADEPKIIKYKPIPEECIEDLKNNGFCQMKIMLVRIARKTDLKVIISSDKDSFLLDKYRTWLQTNLGINTIHPLNYNEYL
jgi:hypothetical protein